MEVIWNTFYKKCNPSASEIKSMFLLNVIFYQMKVIDTLTQDDFYGAFQRLLER